MSLNTEGGDELSDLGLSLHVSMFPRAPALGVVQIEVTDEQLVFSVDYPVKILVTSEILTTNGPDLWNWRVAACSVPFIVGQ